MKEITTEELNEILTKHAEWINSCGSKGVRADLRGADLRGADLRGASLNNANLWYVNLKNANLSDTDLSNANFYCVDLRHANLSGANLWYANLWRSNLWCANLSYANLLGASLNNINLWYVNFRHANLESVNLRFANLSDANLRGANLRYANLWGANLWSAKINFPIACPEKGSFIAFKKVKDDYIVELLIPEDARRCSATSEKCRCDKAKVLSITKLDGTSDGVDTVYSIHDDAFAYKIGEIVEVKDFDDNRWNECSTGIHFFLTRQEAVKY